MAEIISMSMDEETLHNLDTLQKELEFSSRSETIRQCIRLFTSEHKQSQKLTGEINGIVLVAHPDELTEQVSAIRHAFQSIIKTQVHNHLENHSCLEIFIIKGPAESVKRMIHALQGSKKTTLVKLLVV